MIIGVNGEPKYTRLEYPVIDWQECLEIEQQLNDIINRGHHSEIPFVRSMYCLLYTSPSPRDRG